MEKDQLHVQNEQEQQVKSNEEIVEVIQTQENTVVVKEKNIQGGIIARQLTKEGIQKLKEITDETAEKHKLIATVIRKKSAY